MRPLAALLLLAAVLGACGPAAATEQPPVEPSLESVTTADAILVSEGGVLRPLANGGRVAVPDGWATVTFSPPPLQRSDMFLDIGVLDAKGRVVEATVDVTYEMVVMDHGTFGQRATIHEGRHRVPLQIVMPGSWRFTVRIDRAGVVATIVIVVPEIG